eukprot:NODE_475_length_6994_cov_1.213198.p4 type:complete len:110 gc:universal NODE_475_length_6994_cov_1.213198:2263-1934(-)
MSGLFLLYPNISLAVFCISSVKDKGLNSGSFLFNWLSVLIFNLLWVIFFLFLNLYAATGKRSMSKSSFPTPLGKSFLIILIESSPSLFVKTRSGVHAINSNKSLLIIFL